MNFAQPNPAALRVAETTPAAITTTCPTGLTPDTAEGLTLDRPLFARVTYRPASPASL